MNAVRARIGTKNRRNMLRVMNGRADSFYDGCSDVGIVHRWTTGGGCRQMPLHSSWPGVGGFASMKKIRWVRVPISVIFLPVEIYEQTTRRASGAVQATRTKIIFPGQSLVKDPFSRAWRENCEHMHVPGRTTRGSKIQKADPSHQRKRKG